MTQPRNMPLAVSLNSGTIGTTGTFQTAASANWNRQAGIVQNHGAGGMEAFLGPAASATAGQGITIPANGTLLLNFGAANGIYTGEVAITGTSPQAWSVHEFT